MSEHVRIARQGAVGRVTLTRPRAINALTRPMITAIDAALVAWAGDPAVECVLVDAEGDRGFCAGGDVAAVRDSITVGGEDARRLWRDEYRMNARIGSFPKPVVSLLHGVVLGGGVGLGCHASHRVVTGDTRLGMPEVAIGLSPDVGGSWLFSHAPGELGTHLGLTGSSVGPADAIACGLADIYVPAVALPGLAAAASWVQLSAALAEVATAPAPGELAAARPWIDACYAGDDATVILDRLATAAEPAAREAAALVATRSPTAVALTLAAFRRARVLPSLEAALAQEYRVVAAGLTRADVAEGIRAQVVDKDRRPRWSPSRLADVDPAEVARHFELRPGDELVL